MQVPEAQDADMDMGAKQDKKAGSKVSGGVDLTVDISDESDDERDGRPLRFPKPRGRAPTGMRWNSRTGVWVPQSSTNVAPRTIKSSSSPAPKPKAIASGSGTLPPEEPSSVNLVSANVIRQALGALSSVAALCDTVISTALHATVQP